MLQRIQTYYLGIILLIQVVAISGMDFVRFYSEKYVYVVNAWGVTLNKNANTTLNLTSDESSSGFTFPVFIGFISLALLAFLCIMSYKKLDRQLKIGRILFYLYFVLVLGMFITTSFGEVWIDAEVTSKEIGLPYWAFICGLPLAFLANTGIKRDKRLLDSLKRL